MKKFYKSFSILSVLFFFSLISSAQGNDKVPVVMFDFTDDNQGWVTHNLDAHNAEGPLVSWVWQPDGYFDAPGGLFVTRPNSAAREKIRNTWAISPVIDLSKVENAEIFLSYVHRYGTPGGNKFRLHAQVADQIDINLEGDSAFIKQWGTEFDIDLDQQTNEGELGIPHEGYDGTKGPYTTSPLNLSMFDGKKIRLGLHFYNLVESSNNSKNLFFKSIQVAGNVIDNDPPVVALSKIDSIGNTFVRGIVSADEISKVFWAVKPQGQSVTDVSEIKANMGGDDFVSSGVANIIAADRNVLFTVGSLEINTDYTLFYGAEDFQGNISALQTMNFSTDNDLIAPVVGSIDVTEITQITATANLLADELGTITYRVYNAGWEPTSVDEFESGTASVQSGTLRFDTLETAEDWAIEGLTLNSSYIVYATVTDLTNNVSEIFKSDVFTTLPDNTNPEITSLVVTDITNHGGTMKLTATEPIAGYGDAYAYWIATEKGTAVTKEEVLNRTGAYASGTALLDSATKENVIMLDNLERNSYYTIHVVVQDGSENVSEVSSYDVTTTDELQSIPVFIQEFDVENQNYHFVNVNVHEDREPVLTSYPEEGYVEARSRHAGGDDREFWQDAWVMVGPVDLTGIVDAAVEFNFRATYGLYADHVSLWISKGYKPGDAFDINSWTQFSETGDFPKSNVEQTILKNLPAGFDTAGVYIGIRYYHNLWALNYAYQRLTVMGKTIGEGDAPVIDWVEAKPESSTSAAISFTGSDYGRMFYYLVKDNGETPAMPSYQKVIAGDGAAVNGYRDYTAGNFIDQNFTVNGLEPNTKYHLYTGFRNLKYNESDDIYYDSEMTVFTTPSLELLSLQDSTVFATNAIALASGSTMGRVYWTVKGAEDTAPESLDEIMASFSKRGSAPYQLADQSNINWNITGLKPDSTYVCYAVLADATATYASNILNFAINTPALEIRSVEYEEPIAVDDVNFSLPFNIQSTSNGKIYLVLADGDAEEPAVEDILEGTAGFTSASVTVEDIDNIVLQLDSLTNEQVDKFRGYAVIASGDYVSEVYVFSKNLTSAPINPVSEVNFNVWSRGSSIMIDLDQLPDRAVRVYDLNGRVLAERKLNAVGVNQIDSFNPGIYIVVMQQNARLYSKKVLVK